jgi:hypothetical protein
MLVLVIAIIVITTLYYIIDLEALKENNDKLGKAYI